MFIELKDLLGDDLFVIAGPCVIESPDMVCHIAEQLKKTADQLGIRLIFKASFDKANRSSLHAFRGIGMHEGLAALQAVKDKTGLPILTDVHAVDQIDAVAEVADVLQIPAFLCRQTDILVKAAQTGRIVQIKKGQFVAPHDMKYAAEKVTASGNAQVILCERGTSFGYGQLVVDMRALKWMQMLGFPVVFDGTHAVQKPGALGGATGGDRDMVPLLMRAAVAAGVQGVFLETHPNPDQALSDGANSLALDDVPALLQQLIQIHRLVHAQSCPSTSSSH